LLKRFVGSMDEKQFNKFWELRCPKCNEPIDIEILINQFNSKLEKVQVSGRKKAQIAKQ
jgi:hypothetical protein